MTIGFLIITPDIFFFYIRYLSNHIRQIIKILKNGQQTEKKFNFSLTDTYSLQFGSVCPPLRRDW